MPGTAAMTRAVVKIDDMRFGAAPVKLLASGTIVYPTALSRACLPTERAASEGLRRPEVGRAPTRQFSPASSTLHHHRNNELPQRAYCPPPSELRRTRLRPARRFRLRPNRTGRV